jgi:hypothetical protein
MPARIHPPPDGLRFHQLYNSLSPATQESTMGIMASLGAHRELHSESCVLHRSTTHGAACHTNFAIDSWTLCVFTVSFAARIPQFSSAGAIPDAIMPCLKALVSQCAARVAEAVWVHRQHYICVQITSFWLTPCMALGALNAPHHRPATKPTPHHRRTS